MTKELFFEYLKKADVKAFYLLDDWLGGIDENSDEDKKYMLYLDHVIHGNSSSNNANDQENGACLAICSIERCTAATDIIKELFSAIEGKGNYTNSVIQSLRDNPYFQILFLELLCNFTYWGLFMEETLLLTQRILSLDIGKENNYFQMEVSTAICVNCANIVRNTPDHIDVGLFVTLAEHGNDMISATGYQILYLVGNFNPKALKQYQQRIRNAIQPVRQVPNKEPLTLLVKAQGKLSNVNYLINKNQPEQSGPLFNNPALMCGMIKSMAPAKIASYAQGLLQFI